MAFSQARSAAAVPGTNARTELGEELAEVVTSSLGFKAIAGEVKLQLFPSSWPSDQYPPTTSSLLSIASTKGLLAAASPDRLIVASTDSVRKAFTEPTTGGNIKSFTPALSIPAPRLSHVAFTSDGSCLVLAAEQGGGLAVHSVENLLKNNTNPVIELRTNGAAIQALVPNPAPESAHLIAVVLVDGQLLVANLQDRSFANGVNGVPSFQDGVRSVAWSVRGRQLIAGRLDGTAVQLDFSGAPKAVIPRPPGVESDKEVSTILWLANDEFMMVHSERTPSNAEPHSKYHYVRTDKDRTAFQYRNFQDPCFDTHSRSPASLLTCRLRKWHTLEDAVIITSAASPDVGLLTNTRTPLMPSDPAKIVNTYTLTVMGEEARRAVLPMSVNDVMADTFPIGLAVDLSSNDKVYQPIPGDDLIVDDSPHPLPAVMALNQEGILCCWWFVYDEALRIQGAPVPYPELQAVKGTAVGPQFTQRSPVATLPSSPAAQPLRSPINPSPFGASTFAKPAQPAFGASGFAAPAAPAFGSSTAMGSKPSLWGSSATSQTGGAVFGQSTLPSTAPAGAFGAPSSLGQRQTPWGSQSPSASNNIPKITPFGASATGPSGFAKLSSNTASPSPFVSMSGGSTASPFGSMAGASTMSPFGSIGGNTVPPSEPQARLQQPVFAAPARAQPSSIGTTPQPSFGSTVTIDSSVGGSTIGSKSFGIFGNSSPPKSVFGQPSSFAEKVKDREMSDSTAPEQPSFRKSNQQFTIGSTFKAGKEKESDDTSAAPSGFSFGSGFTSVLGASTDGLRIKSEPPEENSSLFNIPPLRNKPMHTLDSKQTPHYLGSVQKYDVEADKLPEPPQVTSKPMPSPTTGSSSIESTDRAHVPSAGSSPHLVERAESPGYSSERSESEEASDEASDEDSDVGGQPALESLHRQSPGSRLSWMKETTPGPSSPNQPLRSSPHATSSPFGKASGSPLPSRSGFMPPAPTPPVAPSSKLLFASNTTTPAGQPQPAFQFPPPEPQNSPRSPSPVRRPLATSVVAQSAAVSRLQEEEEAGQQDEEKEKEAVLALYDDEDDRIRNQLAAPIEPTLDLAPFLAHQDYVGHVVKEGIAGHVERIYRDINSMVDTLGLNARSLTSYINGHAEVTGSSAGLGREELDDESKQWRVDELFKLEDIQGELERSVEQGRVTEVLNALAALATLSRDVSNLKRDSASIRRFLEMKKSPDLELRRRAAPLEAGWSAAERKLRSRVAEFQKQMAEAEDKATVLRAKIASHSSKGVPTVEAVENTIRKMTSMVEKRSGDIDVLEMQMRKLGLVGGTGTPKKKHVGSSEVGMSLTLAYGEERSGDGDGKFDQAVGRALELRVRRRTMLTLLKEGLEKRSADGVAVTP